MDEAWLTQKAVLYLQNYKAQHPEQYGRFQRQVANEIDYWRDFLSKIPAGKERARVVHNLVDAHTREIDPQIAKKIQCRKGCDACCTGRVEITLDEAALLVEQANLRSIPLDPTSLRSASENSPCIFLKDHKCRVYANRPTACRNHFVTSNPKVCSEDEGNISTVFNIRPELIASAAINLDKKAGSMAKVLAAYLEDQQM